MRVPIAPDSADESIVSSSGDGSSDQWESDNFMRLHGAVSDSDRGDAPTSETSGNISSLNSNLGMSAVIVDPPISYIDTTDDTALASPDPAGSYQTAASQHGLNYLFRGVN